MSLWNHHNNTLTETNAIITNLTTTDATLGNLHINGNLYVNGVTTTINSTTDNVSVLNTNGTVLYLNSNVISTGTLFVGDLICDQLAAFERRLLLLEATNNLNS